MPFENISSAMLPALNATLNATSAILLLTGRQLIRRRKVATHRVVMIAAVVSSTLFLISYLYYHLVVRHGQPTHYMGRGLARGIYFSLLTSHTLLAIAIVPMVLVTLARGLRRNDDAHRRLARWTYPLWLYVSVTGVIIYFMLYRF